MTTQELDTRSRTDERVTSAGQGWLLKACERCGGDLVHDVDEYGDTGYACLQCGHSRPVHTSKTALRHTRRMRLL